jgi:hypothetical protein
MTQDMLFWVRVNELLAALKDAPATHAEVSLYKRLTISGAVRAIRTERRAAAKRGLT